MAKVIDIEEYREKTKIFRDREHAGTLLAEKLIEYHGDSSTNVIAIPAGGVPVASKISQKLDLLLDLAVTRKLHVPWNPEAGFGAVTTDGTVLINEPLLNRLNLSEKEIQDSIDLTKKEISDRLRLYKKEQLLY